MAKRTNAAARDHGVRQKIGSGQELPADNSRYRVNGQPGTTQHLLDPSSELDRAFFERHVARTHRIRLADAGEIALIGDVIEMPDGFWWYCAVKNVAPGMRLRRYFAAPLGIATHEDAAEYIFLTLSCDRSDALEAAMKAARARA